ncbi:MAG TPA: hypothetical protein VF829_03125 [Candidatus Paceibacterota bacterium]
MNESAEYQISVSYLTIRDAAFDADRLRFHIESGDYFGVLATTLGFIEEKLQECDTCTGTMHHSEELALTRMLREEAQHLRAHYDIQEKA